jgi:GMP synthase-like glutamine amidotransferase
LKKTVYCSDNHTGEANWLVRYLGFTIVKDISDATLLLIGGGQDISPDLYKAKKSVYTAGVTPRRDSVESSDFNAAFQMGIPIIGICRGAQLACALSGGKLIQHVTNHSGDHRITYLDGSIHEVTSIHHQMLYPYDMPKNSYEVIAWSTINRSRTYVIDDSTVYNESLPFEDFKEPEITWLKNTNSLGIQGHPEFMCGYRNDPEGNPSEDLQKIIEIFNLFYSNSLENYIKEQKQRTCVVKEKQSVL